MIILDIYTELYLGLITNCISIFLLSLLTWYSLGTFSIKNKVNRFFYLLIMLSFFEILVHLFTTISQFYSFWGMNFLGVFLYSFVFVLSFAILLAWVGYFADKLSASKNLIKNYEGEITLLTIPLITMLILSFCNIFTPIFFSYTCEAYDRKALYNLNVIVPICYFIYGLIKFYQSKNKRWIYQQIPFCELIIPVITSHVIEWFFVGVCFIPFGNMVTILILVLHNVKQTASVDGLTGLYSRRELYDYLEKIIDAKKGNKPIIGILLDLDKFKMINDTYGHLAGDDVLSDFGYIIRKNLAHDFIGFRYAGDEFIILSKDNDMGRVSNLLNKMMSHIEKLDGKYKIAFSYGIAYLERDDSISDFIERMDYEMYKHKDVKRSAE